MARSATMPSKEMKSRLRALADETNEARGPSLVYLDGTSARWPDEKIIPTGSLSLDMTLGIGGWPRGRIIELYGEYSSGKTTLALHTVREAQLLGMTVVYIDAENALDPVYMRKLGVNPELMLISQPDSLENGLGLIRHLAESAKEQAPNGLLIVVDSIPAMVSRKRFEADDEQEFMALEPRVWSQKLPIIVPTLAEAGVTLIMLNQMRSSMNMYQSAADTTPGGKALRFYYSVRCEIRRQVDGKRNADGSDGQFTTVKTTKNKVGSPFKEATYYLPAGRPIDYDQETVSVATRYGIVWADTKYEDGDVLDKKGWFAYKFRDGDLDAIREDERDTWVSRARSEHALAREAALEEWLADGNDEADFTYPDLEVPEFESEWRDDAWGLSVYREGAFTNEITSYPRLVDRIRSYVLDVLNEGDQELDPDAVEVDED